MQTSISLQSGIYCDQSWFDDVRRNSDDVRRVIPGKQSWLVLTGCNAFLNIPFMSEEVMWLHAAASNANVRLKNGRSLEWSSLCVNLLKTIPASLFCLVLLYSFCRSHLCKILTKFNIIFGIFSYFWRKNVTQSLSPKMNHRMVYFQNRRFPFIFFVVAVLKKGKSKTWRNKTCWKQTCSSRKRKPVWTPGCYIISSPHGGDFSWSRGWN